ncbi:aspartate aminotransferase family protein [Dasania marina]|uniref:aspartate aminotransferase family protein n=1 Tax=Dasania marina TaxID=471499 RepID=UPI0030DB2899|tara:strand:+ start:7213 stop:8628 length:1416 start_codon:yes stop_codon:yes gene_type:complete
MSYSLPGPKAEAILQRGNAVFRSGGNYQKRVAAAVQAGKSQRPPQTIFAKAEGDFLYDVDGNRYVDFQNGWASNPCGNANPEVIEAVYAAMKQYGFCYEHPLRYELAEKLLPMTPYGHHTRLNYEVSGTEAAEAAIHMALCARKARFIISFDKCFHGMGMGTKLVSGYSSESTRYMEAWKGGVLKAPFPSAYDAPADMDIEQYVDYCLWHLETRIPSYDVPADLIAGVIIEPGLAEGGNWLPPKRFMQGVKRICEKFGWLFICDEVLTGLGRTGKTWGIEHFDIKPDILVIGKNITGGIEPIAVVTATEEVLGDNTYSSSGSTYAGTPAGCAAALKTLEIYERDQVVAQAAHLAEVAAKRMALWPEMFAIVGEVRNLGMLMSAHIVDPNTGEASVNWGMSVGDEALRRGAFVVNDHENTIRLYPSLTMREETLLEGLSLIEEAIRHVEQQGPLGQDDDVYYPHYYTGFTGY